MSKTMSREDVHSEMLLTLAGYWRSCAAQSNEPWRSDMMRDTAKEFERAAAKATSQTPAALSSYDSSSSRRSAEKDTCSVDPRFTHMAAATSHLSHPKPGAHDAEHPDRHARAMPPNQERVAAPSRGFIIFESDEPLIATLQPYHQNVLRWTGPYAEMAAQLQVSPGTLRSRLHRARAALVALRQKQSGPEGLS